MNKEIAKIGKKEEAVLLYKGTRDGFKSETLWKKCFDQKDTITLVHTDLNTVIGFYCPQKWEDTTSFKNFYG